jgi:predicted nucleic acid-binding protein
MSLGSAVSNASPLIALHQIGRLELIQSLFSEIAVPRAVAREIAPSVGSPPWWIRVHAAPKAQELALSRFKLDPGEREAIALALHESTSLIVLDDLSARITAERLGLNVIGTVGLLLQARRRGLIGSFRTELDALMETGFYISRPLYLRVLADAGEPIP